MIDLKGLLSFLKGLSSLRLALRSVGEERNVCRNEPGSTNPGLTCYQRNKICSQM